MNDQDDRTIDRRSFLFGSFAALGIGAAATLAGATADDAESTDPSVPSSELVEVNASTYDMTAGMCSIDLLVDVGDSERVVIQNELPGGSDRTVENTGERILTTVVPWDSEVLIYAVDLEAGTSAPLKRYHISEDCTLSEVDE